MDTFTSDSKKLAIVVVQGSFHTPQVYHRLTERLKHHGHATFQPGLPSCSKIDDADFPSKTLHDDSAVVKSVVEQLVTEQNRTVFVIMHSYGGLVGTNAISEELSCTYRKSAGLLGGVVHLFYIAAFVLDVGQSVLGTFGDSPNNEVKASNCLSVVVNRVTDNLQHNGRCYFKGGASLLYNDLPDDEAALWESRLIPQSYAVQTSNMEHAAYKHTSSTYLICEKDKALPPQYQEMFAKAAGAKIFKMASGHMPMLSQLDVLVKKVMNAVDEASIEI
jgi:pimeloyl-ACP methyl ester carboxylesterase